MTIACKNTNAPEPTKPNLSFSVSAFAQVTLIFVTSLWETFVALTIHFELDLCLILRCHCSILKNDSKRKLEEEESQIQ